MKQLCSVGILFLLVAVIPVEAAITPTLRLSEVRTSATAGGGTDAKTESSSDFALFEKAISSGAAGAGGTASASAGQNSNLQNAFGGISASGGAASAQTGIGVSSASSTFKFTFGISQSDLPVRLVASIGQTGTGDVSATLRDVAQLEPLYFARRAAGVSTGSASTISDFVLQAGHVYDLELTAMAAGGQGTTSYSLQLNPIPEPATFALLVPAAGIFLTRRVGRR